MSDPKRVNLITAGAPKSAKKNVTKTLRLTINLDESNESKYPELNYQELVKAEEKKKKVVNGKTTGLDPYSDNDDDVERIAKKFEQKYGGKSTYGRKGRSKNDDFADIGAGYDENDSFIDNTDGYDEMIPPECDTLYGGFYINCGSLEFKSVPDNIPALSDGEPGGSRRNKRRISSSSSSEESSDSSSGSESQEEKEKPAVNGIATDSHNTEHRKKKNKKSEKKKAKKIRRTDSSAANSGKQTSDENNQCEVESADSRTSQSDSLTSKPAPSSENAVTSDSSRDIENKESTKLPAPVAASLEELQTIARRTDNTHTSQLDPAVQNCLIRLERGLAVSGCAASVRRAAWSAAATALGVSRTKLLQRARLLANSVHPKTAPSLNVNTNTTNTSNTNASQVKRKIDSVTESEDFSRLSPEQREEKIVETLKKLKELIEERKPDMLANYEAECARVQEERKKLQIQDGKSIEKRLPKRRFPWCSGTRSLLSKLAGLAGGGARAAELLARRVLPLFPPGFVRMPTLLRQADLNKEIKGLELKRQRKSMSSSNLQPNLQPSLPQTLPDPIHFPSSLTVTTSSKPLEKTEVSDKFKPEYFGSIINSFSLSKDLILEPEKREEKKEELYIPPNNIGSITITPVPNQNKEKKSTEKHKEGLIRVKSPAALNDMVKHDKKKSDKIIKKDTPLHIDTTYQPNKNTPSPKDRKDPQVTQKQIESMRIAENNIPRPALIPVQHSPTFAKPDKRPPEVKKKKDIMIISDVDPLSDINQEPLSVDDSSSDIEVIEEKSDKSDVKSEVKSDSVPCKVNDSKVESVKDDKSDKVKDQDHMDIDMVMRDLLEMEKRTTKHLEQSQRELEVSKFSNNSHSSSSSVKCDKPTVNMRSPFGDHRTDKDKLTELTSLSRMDGCNSVTDKSSKP